VIGNDGSTTIWTSNMLLHALLGLKEFDERWAANRWAPEMQTHIAAAREALDDLRAACAMFEEEHRDKHRRR